MKLSIVTINKNDGPGLEKTIRSVISQSSGEYEHIVIDGKSSDSSLSVMEKYRDHLTFSISEEDNGVYHAMNKGIRKSKGEFILFLNSGDILSNRDVIENVLPELQADVNTGNAIVDYRNNKKEEVISPSSISFYTFYKHTILHQASFIRRKLFTEYGLYDESLKIVGDWEFFIRTLILNNCSYRKILYTISVFDGMGMSSIPSNKNTIKEEREKVLNTHFSPFIKDYQLIENNSIYSYLGLLQRKKTFRKLNLAVFKIINKLSRK